MTDTSTTPVLDALTEAIGSSLALRKSPREIAEAALTAIGVSGYRLYDATTSPPQHVTRDTHVT